MKNLNKVKCKRCSRLILRKTAGKYQGFSRQCLQKYNELMCKEKSQVIPDKILPPIKEQIRDRLTAVLPEQRIVKETNNWIWSKNLQNQIIMSEA